MAYNTTKTDLESEEERQSKINSAGIINITIENLWRDSHSAMKVGDYKRWNIVLDAIWTILGGDVPDGSPDDKKYQELCMAIYKTGSLREKVGKGFKEQSNPNNPLKYHRLLKKSVFLRRLQNKQGKGTAYISEDEDDWN